MSHEKQKYYAYVIDDIIDHYRKTRHTDRIPHKRLLSPVVELVFSRQEHIGKGYFKRVFWIHSAGEDIELALKIGRPEAIDMDWEIYQRAKAGGLADKYFAKCYWRTRYCLLQEFGTKKKVPDDVLTDLRKRAYGIGLVDIKRDNVLFVRGKFKLVDANFKGKRPLVRQMRRLGSYIFSPSE